MVNLDVAELRSKIDTEKLYVDFGVLRNALTVAKIVGDLDISLSEANKDGESRGGCPKCEKEKSFSLNVNTNRFNCFAKGCTLKGGGVIDFFARLYGVSAKEASHLLAYTYGIQPYTKEMVSAATSNQSGEKPIIETVPTEFSREVSNPLPDTSLGIPPLTPAHLIASIEHQLAQLKQLLISR